jgi:hypothetical protein
MADKFLLLEVRDEPDNTFVFHTERPRFLVEFVRGGEAQFIPIDPIPESDRKDLRADAREFLDGEED